MKRTIALLLFVSFLLLSTLSIAESGKWTYYTEDNNLGMVVSHGDYLWCCSSSGIVRWNRKDTTSIHEVFSSPEGCCWYQNNSFSQIAVDRDGVAWCSVDKIIQYIVGLRSYVLHTFDGREWKLYTPANSGFNGKRISAIHIDKSNAVWISTAEGIQRYDRTAWTLFDKDSAGKKLLQVFAVDNDNVKWIRTEAGIASFDGATWKSYTTGNGLPSGTINIMTVDADNVKWFALSDGKIGNFDGKTWKTFDGPGWVPGSLAVDKNKVVWCGSAAGLARFDGTGWITYTTANSGLPVNGIRSIAIDDDGVVWASTGTLKNPEWRRDTATGLTRYDGKTWSIWKRDGPAVFYPWGSIVVDKDNVKWFGLSDWGLSSFDGQRWRTYSMADTIPLWSAGNLTVDNDNRLWIRYTAKYGLPTKVPDLSVYGLLSFDGTTWTKYTKGNSGLPDSTVRNIVVDKNNVKWFHTNNGVTSFDGYAWKTYPNDGIGHQFGIGCNAMIDRNNVAWFRSSGGISGFNGIEWVYLPVAVDFYKMIVDADNTFWLFRGGYGAYSYDGSAWKEFRLLNDVENLAPGHTLSPFYGMAVDSKGVKWFLCAEYSSNGFDGGGLTSYDGKTWVYHRDDFWLLYSPDDITIDRNDVKWITDSSGIVSYDGGHTDGVQTNVSETNRLPFSLRILSNYPNPFNPSTTISFILPQTGRTTLAIYNAAGQKVRELADAVLSGGRHHIVWDGKDDSGNPVSAGIYLAHLKTGNARTTQKMLLLK